MLRAYVRVSSDSQDAASQKHGIDGWLATNCSGAPVWYDEVCQGDAKERPVFARLLRELRKGDTLVVFALDRLSREGIVPVLQVVKGIAASGVRLVSVSEAWFDTDNACWELVTAILAWAAQQEKRRIKERQRAGIAAAKASGKTWGGRKKGSFSKRTSEIDKLVRQLKESGSSVCGIARATKLSRPTIYTILAGE